MFAENLLLKLHTWCGWGHIPLIFIMSVETEKKNCIGEEWDVSDHLKSVRIQTWQGNYTILNHNLEDNFGALLCLTHT